MSPPADVSLDGHLVDEALAHAGWVDLALLLFLVGWLVWVLAKSRGPARYVTGGGLGALAFVVAVFAVADVPLAWASLRDVDGVFRNWPADAMRVEVNAHQWAWNFRSAGDDGALNTADDVVAWNELHVPVDTPVHLQLGSTDVVHGFNVPAFRVKVEVVPGQVSQLWFQAREVGRYEIACSQHCGTNHYRMRGVVVVMTKDAFVAWQHEASALARIADDPDDEGAHWGWEWKPAVAR